MKALIHVRLYDYEQYIEDGYLLFDHAVRRVGDISDFPYRDADIATELEAVIDGKGRLLLPGLINFHTHVYSALARGFDFRRDPKSFQELLSSVWWRMDHFLTLGDLELCAYAFGAESLRKGVVGIVDHHASGVITGSTATVEQGLSALGIHGITCFETSDRFSIAEAIAENLNCMGRRQGLFGLHASMSLSDTTLQQVKAAIGQSPIHCHVAESREDQTHYPESPVLRLLKNGLLQAGSLLAHCVHIDDKDAHIIKSQKAVVVVNPRSNLNNGVGTPPFSTLMSKDIPIVVGTDGFGADVARSWQDFYLSAKASDSKGIASKQVDVKRYLKESYQIYAQLTGRKLGRFAQGYAFDAMLVDYQPFTPIDEKNVFSHVFFGVFDQMAVHTVWIGGKAYLEAGQLSQLPLVDHAAVRELWKRIEASDGYNG